MFTGMTDRNGYKQRLLVNTAGITYMYNIFKTRGSRNNAISEFGGMLTNIYQRIKTLINKQTIKGMAQIVRRNKTKFTGTASLKSIIYFRKLFKMSAVGLNELQRNIYIKVFKHVPFCRSLPSMNGNKPWIEFISTFLMR